MSDKTSGAFLCGSDKQAASTTAAFKRSRVGKRFQSARCLRPFVHFAVSLAEAINRQPISCFAPT